MQSAERKNLPAKNTISRKLSFRYEGEISIFLGKQKLRGFIATRPAFQEMLKGVFQPEIKTHNSI